ncbi:MAG TPA: DEAD/DEAH box helicase [Ilumatobacter sp.]|nr:DEAD/DEAH box helicase [Ilumatobacter sp.]
MRSDRQEILARYPFPIDRFQREAIDAFDAGRHVIVAAPTGSGKTVVAEYAVEAALRDGRRAFYTAPIKALSNQKYRDLVARHGDAAVGLLTGDNAINGDAPIVVMTTEVLRNMVYAGRDLRDLAVVVLDEVHFLQDAYRGPVWEEVIIHLPQHVRLVCLSATVSNSRELAEWVETVRGPSEAILEERRPVELENLYLVHDRTHDRIRLLPTIVDGRPNADALRLDASAVRGGGRDRGRAKRDDLRGLRGSGRRILATPSRTDTVDVLAANGLLPAIFFIFSRNGCSEAARSLVHAGMRFTDHEQRDRIREIVATRLDGLATADLAVLGYDAFVEQLEAGVAAHHAGMIPPFKEIVEACFIEGLISVVFATETLAVGVNMPARSVVIEKLTKFAGDRHETLSPGQFTQLTGRAGRRGIDEHGSAMVLWSPWVRFDQVAELAASRSFHLRSVFRPTYNMAANLVRTYTSERAHQLLALSFAQFQADRDVVRVERRLQRLRERHTELRADAASPYGDVDEYRTAVAAGRGVGNGRDHPYELALVRMKPGALVHVSKGKHHGPAAVVASAHRKGGLKITAITPAGHVLQLGADDFDAMPTQIGTIVLPGAYAPNQTDYRTEVGRRIKRAKLAAPARPKRSERIGESAALVGTGLHPVEADPDLKERLRVAAQAERLADEIRQLEQRVEHRNGTLVREFDQVLAVLGELGYVDVAGWALTDAGGVLARVFHESDLLVAETLRRGLLDGVDPATLAGLVSTFVYEHRSPDDPPRPWFPSVEVRRRWEAIERLSYELATIERERGLAEHRPPDPTFFGVAYAWAAGEGFAEVVEAEQASGGELTGGDFVRTVKQLVDLLGQIGNVAPSDATRQAARQAADAAFRGVVSDSATVEQV